MRCSYRYESRVPRVGREEGGEGCLIEMLAVERQAHAAEQQARVAVVGRGRVEDDVDAGDHLRGIAIL